MKKIFIYVLVLFFAMNFFGCTVVESIKEVASPLQTPPPLKDTEIIVSKTNEPVVETTVESEDEEIIEEEPTPTPESTTEQQKLMAQDIISERDADLYIECISSFGTESTDVSAYLSGGNISARIIYDGTPINAIANENYDYVLLYLDNSFFGAKVTGFEQYNPMQYELMILDNINDMENVTQDPNPINGYECVKFDYDDGTNDYTIWYSQEYSIPIKVIVNEKTLYQVKKVEKIDNMDMSIFEKPSGKMFVDFGDISELSNEEIMSIFG